jgi:hypothetical protein
MGLLTFAQRSSSIARIIRMSHHAQPLRNLFFYPKVTTTFSYTLFLEALSFRFFILISIIGGEFMYGMR